MPRYDELHTTAFYLRAAAADGLDGGYATLAFPSTWVPSLLDLLNRNSGNQRRVLWIDALNRSIRALVPDVAAVARGVSRTGHDGGWLYSARPPDARALVPILHAWVRTHFSDDAATADTAWQSLDLDALSWDPIASGDLGWPS